VAPIRWTKPALVARLQYFEEKLSGSELIDAVVSFADGLEPEDRELLQDALLEQAEDKGRIVPPLAKRQPRK
jgi:hypothetical protein